MCASRSAGRGFTLLEVIVALAILSMSMTVILRIFSGTAGAARVSGDYYTAVHIAESRLAQLMTEDYVPGEDEGEVDDRFRWQSVISEYEPEPNEVLFGDSDFVDLEDSFVPYLFEVTVSWGDARERSLALSTIRLDVPQ